MTLCGAFPSAIEALDEQSAYGLSVSFITLGEVYEGIYRHPDAGRQMADLHNLLQEYSVLGLSDPIMQVFAQTRLSLRQSGQMISDLDMLIASTAIVHNLTLMTRNLRHFSRISDLRLFTTDDA